MGIFKNISDIKEHIGGAGNLSIHIDSIGPHELPTFNKHLQKWIGQDLYADIIDNPATTEKIALLPYVAKPLAFLLMYEYSKVNSLQISEQGNIRYEREEAKSAYKYQENEYRDYMLHTGYESLEELLKFLAAKSADYPLWKNSIAFKCSRNLFINYAAEFRAVYSHYISRYTFDHLRALVADLEVFAIQPTIGRYLFDALKLEVKSGAIGLSGCTPNTASPCEANRGRAVAIIQSALANFTIEEGMRRLWLRIDKGNVVQTEQLGDQGYQKKSPGKNVPVSQKIRHHDEWANRHTSNLLHFLNTNISCFPEYQQYLDEQKEEEKEKEDECCEWRIPSSCSCGCGSHGGCNHNKSGSIIHL